jgi:hypothetical protein
MSKKCNTLVFLEFNKTNQWFLMNIAQKHEDNLNEHFWFPTSSEKICKMEYD